MAYRNDRDDQVYVENTRREKSDNGAWKWLLMLPLFFFFGWLTNDMVEGNRTSNGPEAGIGGGPYEEEMMSSPSPMVEDVTISPELSPLDQRNNVEGDNVLDSDGSL